MDILIEYVLILLSIVSGFYIMNLIFSFTYYLIELKHDNYTNELEEKYLKDPLEVQYKSIIFTDSAKDLHLNINKKV